MEVVRKWWKTCGRRGRDVEGPEEVQRSRRPWKSAEEVGSNGMLHAATKYVGSHSQLAVFPKKEMFQFGSPVLGLSVSGKIT